MGIFGWERHQNEEMRASRLRLATRFPVGLEPAQAFATLDGLSGLPYTTELTAEITASEGSITHALWVPSALRPSAQAILSGVIPSLRVAEAPPSPDDAATLSLRLFIPTPVVLSTDN